MSGALLSVCVFSWYLAFGVRQPSEARAGLVAVGVVVAWLLLAAPYQGALGHAPVLRVLRGLTPLGLLDLVTRWVASGWGDRLGFFGLTSSLTAEWPGWIVHGNALSVVALQLALAGLLLAWTAWRFARPGRTAP